MVFKCVKVVVAAVFLLISDRNDFLRLESLDVVNFGLTYLLMNLGLSGL